MNTESSSDSNLDAGITSVVETDRLNLSSNIPNVPDDIVFPDELNRYLRDQLQHMRQENSILKSNLSQASTKLRENDATIDNLRRKLEEYVNATKSCFTNSSNVASSRIVELSKKLREKSSETEALKTKISKLEKALITEMNKHANFEVQTVPEKQVKPNSDLEEQLKIAQDKLNSTTHKLFEAKNSNIQLKNDIKVANKLLQQEIGENFESIQNCLNSPSNWRGRAQIICDLQQKLSELKEKLKMYQEKGSVEIMAQEKKSSQFRFNKRIQELTKENDSLKHELEDAKRKLSGCKARNKVLESDCNSMRIKLSTLSEQSEKDHEIVTSLMVKAQVTNTRGLQSDDVKQKQKIIASLEEENKNLKIELTKERCKHDNLRHTIEKNSEKQVVKEFASPGSSTENVAKDNTQEKIVSRLTAEKERLLELMNSINRRLEKERDTHAETHKHFLIERKRAAKLESKLARAQLDYSERGSTYSISSKQSISTLEDQLELAEENIKALRTRLDLEKEEREYNLQEFSRILQNHDCFNSQNINIYTS